MGVLLTALLTSCAEEKSTPPETVVFPALPKNAQDTRTSSAQDQQALMEKLMSKAQGDFEKKQLQSYISMYEKILKMAPDDNKVKKKLALLYFQTDNFDQARMLLLILVGTDEADADVYHALGAMAFNKENDRKAAQFWLKKALAKNPKHENSLKLEEELKK